MTMMKLKTYNQLVNIASHYITQTQKQSFVKLAKFVFKSGR